MLAWKPRDIGNTSGSFSRMVLPSSEQHVYSGVWTLGQRHHIIPGPLEMVFGAVSVTPSIDYLPHQSCNHVLCKIIDVLQRQWHGRNISPSSSPRLMTVRPGLFIGLLAFWPIAVVRHGKSAGKRKGPVPDPVWTVLSRGVVLIID